MANSHKLLLFHFFTQSILVTTSHIAYAEQQGTCPSVTMSSNTRRRLIRHNRAMETGYPSIEHSPEFHNDELMRQAWDISPYNRSRDKKKSYASTKPSFGEQVQSNTRDTIIRKAMCFQPVSGYCGLATVNTVLSSLPKQFYVPYPDQGRGYSLPSLAEYIILNCVPYPLIDVDAIYMQPNTTIEEFRSLLRLYANSSDYRLLANFHRTPLFYSERSTEEEAYYRAYAGHWSPVGGIIESNGKEYVLVLDTNEKYGPFMVKLQLFFNAVKTLTLHDGYRGFIKVKINHNHGGYPAPSPRSVDC